MSEESNRDATIRASMPTVGESFRLNYGEGHRQNKLIHVRAVIDDEYVVIRYWKRGEWVYRLEDETFFFVNREILTKAKARK